MVKYSLLKSQLKLGAAMGALMLGALFYSSAALANSVGGLESLTNQQRAANGLAALTDDGRLDAAAANKAADMLANNYWAHTSPTGVSPWYWFSAAGYPYRYAGENLAQAYYSDNAVIIAWMASSGHRANILNPNFRNIGCASMNGSFQGSADNIVTVCMYGSTSAAPVPAPIVRSTPAPTSIPSQKPIPVVQTRKVASAPVFVAPTAPQATPIPVARVIEPTHRTNNTTVPAASPARQQGSIAPLKTSQHAIASFIAILEAMALPWANVATPVSLVAHMAQ